jgi:hypothetical protein
MWGFPHVNIYSSFPIDKLHQCHNGLVKRMLEALEVLLKTRYPSQFEQHWGELNRRLRSMSQVHECFVPTKGLDAPKLSAEERRAIMRFIGVALNGLVSNDRFWLKVVGLFAGRYGSVQRSRRLVPQTASVVPSVCRHRGKMPRWQ